MNTHYVPSRRKVIAGAAAFAVTLSLLPLQALGAFQDVGSSTSYSAAIKDLEAKGVIEGYADGTFKPKAGINRAEFLKILLEAHREASLNRNNCFPDVTDQWFAVYVCDAEAQGIVEGYPDGTFKPDQPISFVEAAKILSLAYKQPTQAQGGEWYEPFARALESTKAIPPSIGALDAKLNRGEMAEMMWRISENKTDQPTKSYLNVKYPDVKADLSSNEPQLAASCTDLKAFVSESQVNAPIYYMRSGQMELQDAPAPMLGEKSLAANHPTDAYSTTNVQVQGVDEGDIVKTNGSYVYALSRRDSTIRVIDVKDSTKPVVISTIKDKDFLPSELYVDGMTLAVVGQMSQAYPYPVPLNDTFAPSTKMIRWPGPMSQKTTVKLYDVSSAANPKNTRTVSLEGSSISTRLVDGKLLLALTSGPRWYGAYADSEKAVSDALVPVYDDSVGNVKDRAVTDCTKVTILPRVPRPQYLVVASLPLTGTAPMKSSVILGNGQNIYVSLQNLYVASTEWTYSWGRPTSDSGEKTNVYRFSFDSDGTVDFAAHGSVPGHILNQFSMDENGDTFRIATTVSPQWTGDGEMEDVSVNDLFVLNKNLETVGSITDIAPGESIYAVRFMGNRAYVVTFKQIDPLFVIDTSDARHPKILGKLKIPGYSNYLHPVDENHVLGFGKEVDESIDKDKVHSDNAVYYTAVLGMKLALFDVTDVEHPVEMTKEVIGARGTDSPLLTDHKALYFDAGRGLLAFPVTVYEKKSTPKVNEYDADTQAVFQGAYVYSFSVKNGFSLKGKISHHGTDEFLKAGDYWYDSTGKDISRILRVGSSLLTVSDAMIKSNAIATLSEQGSATLSTSADSPMRPMIME